MLDFKLNTLQLISIVQVFLFISEVFASEFGFTIEVEAGRTECYFQSFVSENAASIEIDYQVVDGGDMDIEFILKDPHNNIIIHDDRRSDNSHKFDITGLKGDYELCFDNSFSYSTRKTVFFQMYVFDRSGNAEDMDYRKVVNSEDSEKFAALGMAVEDFRAASSRIKEHLNRAEHQQVILRTYEYRDKVIMDANFERVNFWSVINLAIALFVSAFQVFMIRSLFEENSKVGRLLRNKRDYSS